MKAKVLAIIIAAVLLVGAGTGIGFAIYGNLPQNAAMSAIFDAMGDFTKRDEIEPLVKVLSKGSVDFSVNELKSEDVDLMEDAEFSGKLYFSDTAFMLENLKLETRDFKIAGDIYLSDELLYVSEDEILENAYGVKYKDLADDLKNSIFAFGSDSKYAIKDEAVYDNIIKCLEALENEKLDKDLEKLVTKLMKKAWKIACDSFEFESETDEVRIGGEKKKVRVISIVIDGDSLASFVSDYYDYIAEEDDIVEFLEEYGDLFGAIFGLSPEDDKTVVDLYEDYIDKFGDNLDEYCESLEDSYDEEIVINVMTPRVSKKLVKLEVKRGDEEVFDLDIGMDGIKKTDKITLTMDGEKYIYEIKEDNSKEFECVLKNGDNSYKFSIDKKKDEFSLDVNTPNGEELSKLSISGDWVTKLGKTTITVEDINVERWEYSYFYQRTLVSEEIDCEIVLIVDQSDKIPSAPKKYDRISDITEEDIDKLTDFSLEDLG